MLILKDLIGIYGWFFYSEARVLVYHPATFKLRSICGKNTSFIEWLYCARKSLSLV